MNHVAVNMRVQVSLWEPDFSPSGTIPTSGVAGSSGSSIDSFLRALPTLKSWKPCFQLFYKGRQKGPLHHFQSVFLKLSVVCFLDQVNDSSGICAIKDDTELSTGP